MKPVWVIDDDRSIRWVFEKALSREGIPFKTFGVAQEALAELERDAPQVLVSDIRMPGTSGLELLQNIKEKHPQLPVIIMTAYSDLESAVAAFQGGAFEYLPKPFDVDQAVDLIRRAVGESMREEGTEEAESGSPEILGQAPSMQEVFRAIGRLSNSGATVLITGESGLRQGAGRACPPSPQPARGAAVRGDQHRRDAQGPAGERALRPRARRVHRRAGDAARPLRAGRGRDAVPGRDRRHGARPADTPAARPLRRPVLPRGRPPAAQGERSRDRRDSSGSRGTRARGDVPRRPLPPPQRHPSPVALSA